MVVIQELAGVLRTGPRGKTPIIAESSGNGALHCEVVPLPYPLLTTKLYPPTARQERVPRPRLTERLTAGLQRPLTLISAPAGFGKTTLLAQWRAPPPGRPRPWPGSPWTGVTTTPPGSGPT